MFALENLGQDALPIAFANGFGDVRLHFQRLVTSKQGVCIQNGLMTLIKELVVLIKLKIMKIAARSNAYTTAIKCLICIFQIELVVADLPRWMKDIAETFPHVSHN